MAVITKRGEKIENVVGELNEGYSFDDFINKFQELYPKGGARLSVNMRNMNAKLSQGKQFSM